MAADGDCPSQFAGQPWSVWTEHLGRDSPISDEEEIERKHQADAMRLPREDMGLFGHCPERDPFYTVVCEFCNTLVKPQGLRNHMDLWHKVTTVESTHGLEPSEKTIKCTVGPKAGPGAKANSGTVKIKVKKPQSSSSTSVPMERLLASNQPHAGSVLPADGVVALSKGADKILLQSEKAVGMGRSQTVSTGPVSLQVVVELATIMSILPRRAFQAISETLNTATTTTTTTAATATSHNHSLNITPGDQLNHSQRISGSPQKKRLKSDKLPIKEREYDPDKHCGVWNEESNKHCTRSLTCKTHSISMRRAVMGRSKYFDKLLADHRAAKEVAGKLGKALGIVQVAGLDGDGAQLPSPVNGSTTAVPAADLPTSCLGSLPTPMSLSPDPQVNGIQNSSSEPHSPHSPSFPASDPPLITLPDLTIDSFEPVTSLVSLPSKSPVLNSVAHFSPGACHLPRPPEESLEFVPKLEEVTWLRSQPKPLTSGFVSFLYEVKHARCAIAEGVEYKNETGITLWESVLLMVQQSVCT
ncbi:Ataxin-7-like protein 1 [Gryllus bimaculatus]|nr:Ataxin-7-like protein 1 [Gryllus bimaculatus]